MYSTRYDSLSGTSWRNAGEAIEFPRQRAALIDPRHVSRAYIAGNRLPFDSGFDRLSLEGNIPDAVFNGLKARGHDISKVRPLSINGCATAVPIDPANGNRIAGADPRRDCYAIAY